MGAAGMMSPSYRVVETQASNLLVTDNRSNIVYFYTVDRGSGPGAVLHLRGTIDLNAEAIPIGKATAATERPASRSFGNQARW
jgi:hypothetical protein